MKTNSVMRIVSLVLTGLLFLVSMTGCGGSSRPVIDVDDGFTKSEESAESSSFQEESPATAKTDPVTQINNETTNDNRTTQAKGERVGDFMTFGSYEQDNNASNGKEPIEWLVLEQSGSSLLLISKYALDCQPYHYEEKDVTWETCSLRQWLNNEFFNSAFNETEKVRIKTTTVNNDNNPKHGTVGGNDTRDNIFLLSLSEARRYFSSNNARKCVPTDYAMARGAWTSSKDSTGGKAVGWWWLRSPGYYSRYSTFVLNDGSVNYFGYYVNLDNGSVRPVVWIDLS